MRVDEGLKRDIVAAVQAVEQGSAAELVVTVVPRSGAHWDVTLAAALVVTFVVQVLVVLFSPDTSALHVAVDAAAAALAVAGLLRALPWLERLLLPGRVAARRVEVGAESAFCRQGLFRTGARTGVLVYVSLLERRAVLLPDDGVARALPAEALASLRARTAALFDAGDVRAALLALLDLLRRLGAKHLPPTPGDVNELPDAPVTE